MIDTVAIPLANGCTLYSGWIDDDDPDRCAAGDYLKLCDAQDQELVYYGWDELSDPITGRTKLNQLLQLALRRSGRPDTMTEPAGG